MIQTIQTEISKTGDFANDAIQVSVVDGEIRRFQIPGERLIIDGRYFARLLTGEEGQIDIRNGKVTWL